MRLLNRVRAEMGRLTSVPGQDAAPEASPTPCCLSAKNAKLVGTIKIWGQLKALLDIRL